MHGLVYELIHGDHGPGGQGSDWPADEFRLIRERNQNNVCICREAPITDGIGRGYASRRGVRRQKTCLELKGDRRWDERMDDGGGAKARNGKRGRGMSEQGRQSSTWATKQIGTIEEGTDTEETKLDRRLNGRSKRGG